MAQPTAIELSHCTLDLTRHVIRQGEQTAGLTPMETKLLGYLAEREGEAVGADELLVEHAADVLEHGLSAALRRPHCRATPACG